MAQLELNGIVQRYGTHTVVDGVNFQLEAGSIACLLGPSGCGKTTVLRMIAGFEQPTAGTIVLNGTDITGLAPNQRKIGMVFQSYALFPHLNAADNVAFGLKLTKMPAADIKKRVGEMLDLVRLSSFGARFPYQLSGGQQQRVAIARALIGDPPLLLADEPTGNLDSENADAVMGMMEQVARRRGATVLLATHDPDVAQRCDRVVTMRDGMIVADELTVGPVR